MLASVVMTASEDYPHLHEAIERLVASAPQDDCEFIVVTNGSRQATETWASMLPEATILDVGFPWNRAGARNIGTEFASGEHVIFVDEGGYVEADCVAALLNAIETNNAVAVQGRVIPASAGAPTPGNGGVRAASLPSFVSARGASIFRRSFLLDAGGFDPLLDSHEGLLVSATLLRSGGPLSLWYEPRAVFRQFPVASDEATFSAKEQGDRNRSYVVTREPEIDKLADALHALPFQGQGSARIALRSRYAHLTSLRPAGHLPPLSIITTARNAGPFVEEYARSLKTQTHDNFELIFVDDGSTDDTAGRVALSFKGDDRLRLLTSEPIGRSAALNLAISHATHDMCLIADADDISMRYRAAASARLLDERQDLSCLSLWIFSTKNMRQTGQPQNIAARDFRVRSLFGMPASFPAFAFRKSRMAVEFDPTLEAAVDYDWIARNIREAGATGELFGLYGSYYRVHDEQISARKTTKQRETALRVMLAQHEAIVGSLSDAEQRAASVLGGFEAPAAESLREARAYQLRLLEMHAADTSLAEQLALALGTRLAELAHKVDRDKLKARQSRKGHT